MERLYLTSITLYIALIFFKLAISIFSLGAFESRRRLQILHLTCKFQKLLQILNTCHQQ
jgi:hypothetical protein